MTWKGAAVAMLVVGCLFGCDEAGPSDNSGGTRTYLLARADLPQNVREPGVGFNLDGRVSEGGTACDDAPDLTSATGEEGVDNSLQVLSATIGHVPTTAFVDAVLEQIRSGEYLVLIEVTEIDSFEDDPSVGVRLFLGRSSGEVLVAAGMAVEGQSFEQLGDDLATVPVGAAAIAGGVLSFGSPSFPLSFTIDGEPAALTLLDARVRAEIGSSALTNGEVGGHVSVASYLALSPENDEEFVRSVGLPDLDPDPADPTLCRAISVGFLFTAVTANVVGAE